jgi:hypothetical protein
MAIDYRIDSTRGIIFTTATGTLTNQELLAHKQRLQRDPLFHAGMPQLSDVRGVERLDVTPDGIGQFVQHDATNAGALEPSRLAIVAKEDVVFGMARMYQARTSRYRPNVGVFRTIEEATNWLGRES